MTRAVIGFEILGYVRPPLSLNGRNHWAADARHKKDLRYQARGSMAAALLRRSLIDPLPVVPPLDITLVWTVTDRRRRDKDNPFATLKPLIDGVTDALGIDDSSELVTPHVEIVLGERRGISLRVEWQTDEYPDWPTGEASV